MNRNKHNIRSEYQANRELQRDTGLKEVSWLQPSSCNRQASRKSGWLHRLLVWFTGHA